MGLFDRKKEGGFMDVIRCDETKYFVWKWRPSGEANSTKKENAIRYGSSLRVKKGEVAVFFYKKKDGEIMDCIVGPYDDTIKTANFPVLTSIVGAAFGGNSPFQAEIYFIDTESNNQLNFAVPYFNATDPRWPDHKVPVAVRGKVTFTISDHNLFLEKNRLVDFDLDEFYARIKSAMVRKIKGIVANAPYDFSLPLIQLERKVDFLSEVAEERLKGRIDEFGVELKHIDIENIEIDDESDEYYELKRLTADSAADAAAFQSEMNKKNLIDTQAINAENMAETMRIQREEMQRNQRLQTETNFLGAHSANLQADVLKTAASGIGNMGVNLGGGDMSGFNPAGMMMGMALGGSMGGQMNNMMNQMGQQMQNSMSAPPPIPEVKYMLANNGQQFGPFNMMQMSQLVQNGQMTKETYVWKQGMAAWDFAGNVQELASLFMQAAPPPPPPGNGMPPVPPCM